MNLDELRSVQSRERDKDSLQELRSSFYTEVGSYIADLKDERAQKASESDDPFSSPEIRHLTDEIETAEDVARSIYERRMGKIVKRASLVAAGYATDADGLTEEEERLFEDLVERIETNMDEVLDVLESADPAAASDDVAIPDQGEHNTDEDTISGDALTDDSLAVESDTDDLSGVGEDDSAGGNGVSADGSVTETTSGSTERSTTEQPPAETDHNTTDAAETLLEAASGENPDDHREESNSAGDSHGSEGATDETPAPDNVDHSVPRQTVRITEDVGEILGVDELAYDLTAGDVVTLPAANAMPLVEQDVAEPIDTDGTINGE